MVWGTHHEWANAEQLLVYVHSLERRWMQGIENVGRHLRSSHREIGNYYVLVRGIKGGRGTRDQLENHHRA